MSYQTDFISKMAPYAVADMKKNRILASISIAQSCIETGYGTAAVMMKFNGVFGVTASETWLKSGGKAYSAQTWEYVPSNTMVRAFRAYDSLADAFEDHANILKLPYYNKSKGGQVPYDIIGETDYIKAAECLKPYATGAAYVKSVKEVIERYGLTKYDTGVSIATIPPVSAPAKDVIVTPPIQFAQTFNVNDKVKILSSAVMWAGTDVKIPARWKNVALTVQQVKPDRALLKEPYSWVLAKDSVKVG